MRYSIASVYPPALDSKQLQSCNSDRLVPNPRSTLWHFHLIFPVFTYSRHTTANVQLVYEFEKSLTTHEEQKKKGRSEEHSLAHVSYFYIHIALLFYCANDGNVLYALCGAKTGSCCVCTMIWRLQIGVGASHGLNKPAVRVCEIIVGISLLVFGFFGRRSGRAARLNLWWRIGCAAFRLWCERSCVLVLSLHGWDGLE